MDINELITYLITPVGQVALIMGIAEVVKKQDLFEAKFIFILDLILGVIFGLGTYTLYMDYPPYIGVVVGLACGLMAAGLFSGVKNMTETYDDPEFVLDEDEEVEEENG